MNCAGITRDSTLLKMKDADFDSVLDVNLKGVFLVTQTFAREAVQAQKPMSIVNVSSIIAKVGGFYMGIWGVVCSTDKLNRLLFVYASWLHAE